MRDGEPRYVIDKDFVPPLVRLPESFLLRGPLGAGKTFMLHAILETSAGSCYLELREGCVPPVPQGASYVLLDELSSLKDYEEVIRSLIGRGIRVAATTSVYIPCECLPSLVLLPPSFPAISLFRGPAEAEKAFHRYLYEGSLGYGHEIPGDPRIRKRDAYLDLLGRIASGLGRPLSIADISKGTALSKETVRNYIRYAMEDGVLFPVHSITDAKVIYYFTDNSFLWLFRPRLVDALYENVVALALFRKYREALRYVKLHGIDFLTPDGTAIRVKLRLDRFSRTKNPGGNIFSSLPGAERYLVLTENEDVDLVIRGQEVKAVPCWKWLSGLEE